MCCKPSEVRFAINVTDILQSDCLAKFLPNSTCAPTDSACVCADVALMGNVQVCTLESCTIKESLSEHFHHEYLSQS